MTVKEMIAILSEMDEDLDVWFDYGGRQVAVTDVSFWGDRVEIE